MSDKILKFSAVWCQPCKQISKTISEMDLSLPIEEIDIEQNEQAAINYKIRSVPTLVLIRGGKEISRITGSKTAEQIKQFAAG